MTESKSLLVYFIYRKAIISKLKFLSRQHYTVSDASGAEPTYLSESYSLGWKSIEN